MPRLTKRRSHKRGLAPGSLVFIGDKATEITQMTVIDYNEETFQEQKLDTVEKCQPFKKKPTVTWLNIDGLSNVEVIRKVGETFDLHPLILEDIVNTTQRPKFEDVDKYAFVVLKMLTFDEEKNRIGIEQVSLVLGDNFVISFQERVGDVFEAVRDRIRQGKGRIRKAGSDYLLHALIDAVVDNYFIILEKVGDKIEELEETIVTDPKPEAMRTIHALKREMIFLRKSVWPLREVINNMVRSESALIQDSTHIYLRDVYDHTIHVIDGVETFRDMLSGLHDTYLSGISNRMNEIMKVLTIFASIFIPLTFIAGIYGMNFNYMPELGWRWAYFGVWGLFVAVAVLMILYFKRKKWL
ncbi:MAG: magnesium/cobalt transporter CorA [candidate division WOR-3 bacterium]|nr:MAG: magnesium/cobalt transporter CorA [candidate division WOR-3 bacterium]